MEKKSLSWISLLGDKGEGKSLLRASCLLGGSQWRFGVSEMMTNDLSLLYGNLTLTKKKRQNVVIDVGDVEDTLKWGKFCLVGKIISEKSFPFESISYNHVEALEGG